MMNMHGQTHLVQEFGDIVNAVVDHHPDVVVGLVLGNLGQCEVLDFLSHFISHGSVRKGI